MEYIIAALASFFIPGLGQLITLRILSAIIWFLACGFFYGLFWPIGLILHILCIIDAVNM